MPPMSLEERMRRASFGLISCRRGARSSVRRAAFAPPSLIYENMVSPSTVVSSFGCGMESV